MVVIQKRQKIIEETDAKDGDDALNDVADTPKVLGPSSEALAKMTEYRECSVGTISQAAIHPNHSHPIYQRRAGWSCPRSRVEITFPTSKILTEKRGQVHHASAGGTTIWIFPIFLDEDDEPEWYVPAGIPPSELQSTLVVIDQFLETPYDLKGKKVSELLSKPRRRRRRRPSSPVGDLTSDEDEPRKTKKEKKKKEKEQYKSAVLIEDSDAEYGDIEAFLEKEKALREKTARAAAATGGIGTMKSTGTKKRRKRTEKGAGKKRKKGNDKLALASGGKDPSDESDMDNPGFRSPSPSADVNAPATETRKPRPRPKPRMLVPQSQPNSSPTKTNVSDIGDDPAGSIIDVDPEHTSPKGSPDVGTKVKARRITRVVITDDEE
jgi:replication fork protection complex subunit Tof1/Swi1